ncbi:MAG: hypothetical protein M1834_005691 [Cirrosporium novae-zelandiae]|nr:MAG: hypothetical protein M1834_005691 [Cirrosporium novae-zelandiae]
MSTQASALQQAPWRSQFLDHISHLNPPTFAFSTVERAGPNSKVPTQYFPRARYCVCRGLWTELPENEKNTATLNPSGIFTTECPTITTDARMAKVGHLFQTSDSAGTEDQSGVGSGGGGPVEGVWWVPEVAMQWRIKGRGYVLALNDIEEDNSESKTAKSEVGKRMRCLDEAKRGEWSWKTEILAQFGNLSPGMRGSFRNPPPGTPRSKNPDPSKLSQGNKVTSNDDEIALSNFRVVVIVPDSAEMIDLKQSGKERRILWTFHEDTGEWFEQELWP